ncbi:hypothetical protein N8540_06645 [Gammaproteobacteria bacterium]|nr:hypothetical protein [Gammaproteobacteria bacterium]MDC1423254.1 hypothetical protein [Gammaproteobacteria bacterium]
MSSLLNYLKPRFLAIVMSLLGALLLWMGVVLLGVGGSLYYAFAGVVHVARECSYTAATSEERRSMARFSVFCLGASL